MLDSFSGSAASFSLRLIPTITADTFPLAKLSPERCNLRAATAPALASAAVATAQGDSSIDGTLGQKRKRAVDDAAAAGAKKLALDSSADIAAAAKAPSQHYNTSIVADVMVQQHQQAQQAALDSMPRLSEAIVLLKVSPSDDSAVFVGLHLVRSDCYLYTTHAGGQMPLTLV